MLKPLLADHGGARESGETPRYGPDGNQTPTQRTTPRAYGSGRGGAGFFSIALAPKNHQLPYPIRH